MEKRIQVIDGAIVASIIIQLDKKEAEKFENKDLHSRISNAARDLNVEWAIEVNDDGTIAVCISRTYDVIIGNDALCSLEIASTNFMSAVEKMKTSTKETKKKEEEKREQVDKDEINFVKNILNDIIDDKILSAFLMADIQEPLGPIGCVIASPGRIGQITLRQMCECYLEKYANA